jgi:hypothetical protein
MGDKFDIKYTLLPLDLQVKLWVLALDADTSKVNLAYSAGAFRTSLAYKYGDAAVAALGVRAYTLKIGFNPTSREINVDLGLRFRGFDFDGSANVTRRTVGVGISYGREIVPFPDELQTAFNRANGSALRMVRDAPSASNNPLTYYKLHSDDVSAISQGIKAGQQLMDYGKGSDRLGAALRLNYAPQTGLTVYGVLQYSF